MKSVRKTKNHFGIPYAWTAADKLAQASLQAQRADKSNKDWHKHLDNHPKNDFLGDLLFADVIKSEQDWCERPDEEQGLAFVKDDERLFRDCQLRLSSSLQDGLLRLTLNGISKRGGFLYFTDRLDRCMVYDYRIPHHSQKAAKAVPLVDIPDPEFLYDIASAIPNAEDDVRSALKNALVFGHKIVAHRNTFVHVDRRRDEGTAGPFIDTLILNEMLHKYVYEHFEEAGVGRRFEKAMEVGTGSGMLIAACFQNLPGIRRIVALDTIMESVHCAYRNVLANHPEYKKVKPSEYFVCGRFDTDTWHNYDVVLCNPPYIPLKPGADLSPNITSAVGGTDLMTGVISDVPLLLSNHGFLFMIFSALGDLEFRQAIHAAGVEYENLGPTSGFKVRFDVEEVFADNDWLNFLHNERGLAHEKKQFFHTLRCVAIHKSSAQGFVDNTGLLTRIKQLNNAFTATQEINLI
jgi:methylase of polypeptide subunit release factors